MMDYNINKVKIRKPINFLIGSLLSIISGAVGLIIISLIFLSIELSFIPSYLISDFVELIMYVYLFLILILIAGILIYFEKNKLGGAMALFFGIFASIECYYISTIVSLVCLLAIVGGIIALIPKINIDGKVLNSVKMMGNIRISELSEKLGITEADAELSVINLQTKGEPIFFDKNTRTISYR